MNKIFYSFLTLSVSLSPSTFELQAEDALSSIQKFEQTSDTVNASKLSPTNSRSDSIGKYFEPFTGTIKKNKVRVRLQPTYDAQIVKELQKGNMVVVLDETEDFYAIQPSADQKAYVYRTYVLDNVIEGNRVNVRLKPDTDAPIIAQLNSGDHVEGVIDASNSKWLEIKMPKTTHFYVAKEYLEKAGDANLMARLEKRQEDVNRLLNTTEEMGRIEIFKPFDQINLNGVKANYQHIIADYPEFPEAGEKAQGLLTNLEEAYAAKKMAYLEARSHHTESALETNKRLAEELHAYKSKIAHLEKQIEHTAQAIPPEHPVAVIAPAKKPVVPLNMCIWLPVEEKLLAQWAQETGKTSAAEFYEEQRKQAFVLKGILEPYNRRVNNKPGDYILVDANSKLPHAFLYSTQVNLQDYIGHEVRIMVAPRPKNNFAFPAYYVFSVE